MKRLIFLLLVFTSCNESAIETDFARSNWGDIYEQVISVYQNEPEFVLKTNSISYQIQSLKDTATVNFFFSDNKLISGFVKYHKKSAENTEKLYNAYVKNNRDKFGFETFTGNPKKYKGKVFEQKIWQNDKTVVSIRLDSSQLVIKFYEKAKMPKN
jgi:hypothetical protein